MELEKRQSFIDHLSEFRSCAIKILIAFIVCSLLACNFTGPILAFLTRGVGKLIFTSPQEAFMTNVQIALLVGVFVSLPYITYQIWQFVSEGLKDNEKKYVYISAPISAFLFILGALFGFYVVVPIMMNFFMGFATESLTPMISISKYISFIMTWTFSFAGLFELPLVLVFLTKIGVITPQFLSKNRRIAIVIIFIVAGYLTPPDPISQILMAVPLLVLYELSIIGSRFVYVKKAMV